MEHQNEELLKAWLRLSVGVNNEKLVPDMPYNEALICNILYWHMTEHPENKMTAKQLCQRTRMLKSQMNRTLNNMEQKEIIIRERSETDRRHVFVQLNPSQLGAYQKQHQKILDMIDLIIDKTGTETAQQAISIFNQLANAAMEVWK